jgi:predicted HicB family RNase H-like nuclease
MIELVSQMATTLKGVEMEKEVSINVRGLPLEVKKALRAEAGGRDMSMNQLIIEILIEHVKKGGGR